MFQTLVKVLLALLLVLLQSFYHALGAPPGTRKIDDFEDGAEWKLVEIPFRSLAPPGKVPEGTRWSPDAVRMFGVTTPQVSRPDGRAPGRVVFELDDVALYGSGGGSAGPIATGAPGGISTVPFTPTASIPSGGWVEIAADPERDGVKPFLPDATRLEVIPSSADGLLWVRVTLRETPHDRWIGMNLALEVDGDSGNGSAWWGANNTFKFDRLVTVWCFRVAEGCQGFIGQADAEQVAAGAFVAGGGNLRFAIDAKRRAFVVGVPRAWLGPEMGELRLVAAVGSAILYNDDVPGQGAATLP